MRILPILALLLASTAQAQSTVLWNWNNPNVNYPVCSTTATTWCGLYQMMTNVTNAKAPVLVDANISPTVASVTEPAPARTSGSGVYAYNIAYVYKDGTGTTQTLTSVANPIVVTAPPPPPKMPTNFVGSVVLTVTYNLNVSAGGTTTVNSTTMSETSTGTKTN